MTDPRNFSDDTLESRYDSLAEDFERWTLTVSKRCDQLHELRKAGDWNELWRHPDSPLLHEIREIASCEQALSDRLVHSESWVDWFDDQTVDDFASESTTFALHLIFLATDLEKLAAALDQLEHNVVGLGVREWDRAVAGAGGLAQECRWNKEWVAQIGTRAVALGQALNRDGQG